MESCVFCSIVAGEAPAQRVTETPRAIAIVPLNPVVPGHLLVIPTVHVADFTDDPVVAGQVVTVAADLARHRGGQWNLITSAGPDATQTVFHLHVHLVPRRAGDGLALPWSGRPGPNRVPVSRAERYICRRCLAGDHAFCLGETICPCGRADHVGRRHTGP